ncbi:MAG: hypothetical protein JNL70_13865 [Saprospiraceae bacterium]|nr:hypothetical protein [Saprospiraceae bacterium]
MKDKVTLAFKSLEYDIEDYKFFYNEMTPPLFVTSVTITVPKDIFPHKLGIGLPLQTALDNVEKNNSGMVKYIKKVIEGYSDQPQSELLAFESLEHDGFDMKQYFTYMLSEISMTIEKKQ